MNRKTTPKQTSAIIKIAATSTIVRQKSTMELVRQIGYNDAPVIKEFGLKIDDKFAEVPARILQPPNIEYGDNKFVRPDKGVWWRNDNIYLKPQMAPVWGVLNIDRRTDMYKINDLCQKVCAPN